MAVILTAIFFTQMNNFSLTYFFRKPSDKFHSIEELFNNFQSELPENCNFKNVYLPYHTGLIGRLKNIFFAKKHKNQINHITGDINYIALGLPKKNTILTIHDIGSALQGNKLKKFIISLFWFKIPLKRVAKVTVISEFSKNEVLKTFKINKDKIKIIPNCVSSKFTFTKKKFNTEKPQILLIGTKENKNLLRSFEAVKNIPCKLLIIGKLSDIQKNKLSELNINFENYFNLNFDEIIQKYQQADLLLFPSTYEGFGVPILEAQASGLPVITSNLQPMNKVSGEGALLINPYKINEIKSAIEKIISDQYLRNSLIINGLKNSKKYSSKAIAQMYFNLYQELLTNEQ